MQQILPHCNISNSSSHCFQTLDHLFLIISYNIFSFIENYDENNFDISCFNLSNICVDIIEYIAGTYTFKNYERIDQSVLLLEKTKMSSKRQEKQKKIFRVYVDKCLFS